MIVFLDLKVDIKGLIFDFGSTITKPTTKETREQMKNELLKGLEICLKFDENQKNQFIQLWKQHGKEFKNRKYFVGTGTVFDESSLAEIPLSKKMDSILKQMNVNADRNTVNELCNLYRKPKIRNDTLISNVGSIIKMAYDDGIKCAICSNNSDSVRIITTLKNNDIYKYFDIVIVSENEGFRKPDVRILDKILNKWKNDYNMDVKDMCFVGNSDKTDILLANYCGMKSIHVNIFNDESDWNNIPNFNELKCFTCLPNLATMDTKNAWNQTKQMGYLTPTAIITDYKDFPS